MKKGKTPEDMRGIMFRNFDNFETACKRTASKWKSESLPLNFLKLTLGIIKWKKKKKIDGKTIKLADDYNALVNTMYETFKVRAKEMGGIHVSLDFIAKVVETVKKSFDSANN